MKEIKLVIKTLKQYPDNWFVHPQEEILDMYGSTSIKGGLVVKTYDGEEKDFIELGNKSSILL